MQAGPIVYLRVLILSELDRMTQYWGFPFFDEAVDQSVYGADKAALDKAMAAANVSEQMLAEFFGTVSYLRRLLHDISQHTEEAPSFLVDEGFVLTRLQEATTKVFGISLKLYSAYYALKAIEARRGLGGHG